MDPDDKLQAAEDQTEIGEETWSIRSVEESDGLRRLEERSALFLALLDVEFEPRLQGTIVEEKQKPLMTIVEEEEETEAEKKGTVVVRTSRAVEEDLDARSIMTVRSTSTSNIPSGSCIRLMMPGAFASSIFSRESTAFARVTRHKSTLTRYSWNKKSVMYVANGIKPSLSVQNEWNGSVRARLHEDLHSSFEIRRLGKDWVFEPAIWMIGQEDGSEDIDLVPSVWIMCARKRKAKLIAQKMGRLEYLHEFVQGRIFANSNSPWSIQGPKSLYPALA